MSTNPLIIELPANGFDKAMNKKKTMKESSVSSPFADSASVSHHQVQQHRQAEFAPKTDSISYLHPPAEFAKKDASEKSGQMVQHNETKKANETIKSVPHTEHPALALKSSKLEETLQEESKLSKK